MASKASDGFEHMYDAISRSAVYREAVHEAFGDLPEWVVPYSATSGADLARFANDLGLAPGALFADVACGLGGVGLWIAEHTGADLIGIDFSNRAIASAKELAESRGMARRAQFLFADASRTGLQEDMLDGLLCIDALMFIDAPAFAREAARVLRDDGTVVIRVPERLCDEELLPTMVRDYRPVLHQAGLTIVTREEVARNEPALYRALLVRADELCEELGDAADSLLREARNGIERAALPPRVQNVYIVARKG